MSAEVEYQLNKASAAEIAEHLARCDADFVPPLSGRVKINDYAQKIASNAARFEAWSGGTLVGMVAAYCNNRDKHIAFITSISVLKAWAGKGVASCLMIKCIEHLKELGMKQVSLEVAEENKPAIRLYEKNGFIVGGANAPFISMHLYLRNGEEHG